MSTELERRTSDPPAEHPGIDSWINVIGDVANLARHIADTDFVSQSLRGNPAAVAAAILSGREAGVGPMASLANIAVIRGRPALGAQLMRQLAFAAGHEIRYIETTDTRCIVEGRRKGDERWTRVTFTADQARKARIELGAYPEDKLVARATSRLCRRVFPDAIGGTPYSVEELEDGSEPEAITVTTTGAATEPAPEPPPTAAIAQRKTRVKKPPTRTQPPPVEDTTTEDQPPLPGEDGYETKAESAPEPPPGKEPADQPAQQPITDAQMRKLKTLLTKHGINNRAVGLAITSQLIGRKIETAKELTIREAATLIDTLTRVETIAGEAVADFLGRLTQHLNLDLNIDLDTGEIIQ